MARIGRDHSNWAAGGVMRRDFRNTLIDDTPKKWPAKKDTRKWCKGHVGREHDFKPLHERFVHWVLHSEVCQNCKKKVYVRS